MKITGSVAVVTGAARGIGLDISRHLLAAGARVAMLDLDDTVGAAASALGALGIACDVGNHEAVDAAFSAATKSLGVPRILVNSAAIVRFSPLVGIAGPMPVEAFEDVIRTNLIGTFNTTRRFATSLAGSGEGSGTESRGVIVNFSSNAGADGGENQLGYVASKGAVNAMTLSLARELGRFDIRAVTIQPGIVHTPIMDHILEAVSAFAAANQPFPRRLAEPAECSRLVLHIIENEYLNGSVIRFDGGQRAGYPTNHPAKRY